MNETGNRQIDEFLDRLRGEELTREEIASWEERLLKDPELRREFRARIRMESRLLTTLHEARPPIIPPLMRKETRGRAPSWWLAAAGVGMAASLAVAALTLLAKSDTTKAPVVAMIESADEAAWVSSQPTTVGSDLSAGEVALKNGVAELRFRSGAVVALEAPVRLAIIDPMRCRLMEGTAVVEVPDSAKGFIVETPGGHAVDHGTRFAVSVDAERASSEFSVHSGWISVHQDSGAVRELRKGEAVLLTEHGIKDKEDIGRKHPAKPAGTHLRRLRTDGRETSIIRNDEHPEWLLPEMLMVKMDYPVIDDITYRSPSEIPKDRRALIGFKLARTSPDQVHHARLRLNLVPSGMGFSSLLPDTTTFEVHGIVDQTKVEAWPEEDLLWEDAPGSMGRRLSLDPTDVQLLGTFEVPRGRERGSIVFESEELNDFIRADTSGEVGFLISANSEPIDDWGRVHAFASSTHPSTTGPILELELIE